jgi:hypothetical protein
VGAVVGASVVAGAVGAVSAGAALPPQAVMDSSITAASNRASVFFMYLSPSCFFLFYYTNRLLFVNGRKETARNDLGGYAFYVLLSLWNVCTVIQVRCRKAPHLKRIVPLPYLFLIFHRF